MKTKTYIYVYKHTLFIIHIHTNYLGLRLRLTLPSHGIQQVSMLDHTLFSIYILPLIEIFHQFHNIIIFMQIIYRFIFNYLHTLISGNYSLLNCLNIRIRFYKII